MPPLTETRAPEVIQLSYFSLSALRPSSDCYQAARLHTSLHAPTDDVTVGYCVSVVILKTYRCVASQIIYVHTMSVCSAIGRVYSHQIMPLRRPFACCVYAVLSVKQNSENSDRVPLVMCEAAGKIKRIITHRTRRQQGGNIALKNL